MRALRTSVVVLVCLACLPLAYAQQAAQPALPEPAVKVGDMAPDFTLKDQTGKMVSLHDLLGKQNVALSFFVFAFSPG
jgi:cytochrome oxidase Cu insertion factor (SCO1/SenC/PrrC family)